MTGCKPALQKLWAMPETTVRTTLFVLLLKGSSCLYRVLVILHISPTKPFRGSTKQCLFLMKPCAATTEKVKHGWSPKTVRYPWCSKAVKYVKCSETVNLYMIIYIYIYICEYKNSIYTFIYIYILFLYWCACTHLIIYVFVYPPCHELGAPTAT